MKGADIPATKLNSLEDLLSDPQLAAIGFFQERLHPSEGRYLEIRPPAQFSARPDPQVRFPPLLGEHNEEVAAELGIE